MSAPRDRERDALGRARNARPRDALGRPLPRGEAGVARPAGGVRRSPEEALAEAQRLLDAGLPFDAHEVLEDAWKAAPQAERALWKGLAQLAVGMTHAARGNPVGAAALLRRGAGAIASYRDDAPHGVDVTGLVSWAERAASEAAALLDTAPLDTAPLNAPRLRTRR